MKTRHMDDLDILFKEYDTLRSEVLAGLRSRNTIVSIGLAALGLMWTGAVGLPAGDREITGLVLALGVPIVAMCFLRVWFGEYERVQKAGIHLYKLESKINTKAGVVLLTHETETRNKREGEPYRFDPIVFLFCLTGFLSVLAGRRYVRPAWLGWLLVVLAAVLLFVRYISRVRTIGRLRKTKS